eukprot:5237448-Amphidinium_carterae.1
MFVQCFVGIDANAHVGLTHHVDDEALLTASHFECWSNPQSDSMRRDARLPPTDVFGAGVHCSNNVTSTSHSRFAKRLGAARCSKFQGRGIQVSPALRHFGGVHSLALAVVPPTLTAPQAFVEELRHVPCEDEDHRKDLAKQLWALLRQRRKYHHEKLAQKCAPAVDNLTPSSPSKSWNWFSLSYLMGSVLAAIKWLLSPFGIGIKWPWQKC